MMDYDEFYFFRCKNSKCLGSSPSMYFNSDNRAGKFVCVCHCCKGKVEQFFGGILTEPDTKETKFYKLPD